MGNVDKALIKALSAIASKMKIGLVLACMAFLATANAAVKQLQIGVKHKPADCPITSQNGDMLSMHYTGSLEDGSVFDSSIPRGSPFDFTLGAGQVISGWDKGLLGMCIGEKRKLKIPSHMGYGDKGSGAKIPGGATLIFEVELLNIKNRGPPKHEL